MRNIKKMASASMAACALIAVGLYPQSASAQVACCKIYFGGTLNVNESSLRCNRNTAQTRRLSNGNYEVDFNYPLNDVRSFVKLATLDTQIGGSVAWMIGVSDRAADTSSVFVKIRNHNNQAVNSGFNLCLF